MSSKTKGFNCGLRAARAEMTTERFTPQSAAKDLDLRMPENESQDWGVIIETPTLGFENTSMVALLMGIVVKHL